MKTKKILFVCTGNTCRSPMAELLFNEMKLEGYRASSAGLAASTGAAASQLAKDVALQNQLSLDLHQARQISQKMLEESSLIVAMTKSQSELLKLYFPAKIDKIVTLSKEDIQDPFAGTIKEYEQAWLEIKESLPRLKKICLEEI